MHLTLSPTGPTQPDDAAALVDWLGREPEFRGRVRAIRRPPAGGELGPSMDALTIAVGSGGALTILAASLRAFFAQPRRSDVHIVIADGTGRRVEVDARRVKDVGELMMATFEAEERTRGEPAEP